MEFEPALPPRCHLRKLPSPVRPRMLAAGACRPRCGHPGGDVVEGCRLSDRSTRDKPSVRPHISRVIRCVALGDTAKGLPVVIPAKPYGSLLAMGDGPPGRLRTQWQALPRYTVTQMAQSSGSWPLGQAHETGPSYYPRTVFMKSGRSHFIRASV